MKKLLMIGLVVLVVGVLIVGLVTPIFAHGPDDGGATPGNDETWKTMHEACENGDWEAMAEAAEEVHVENLDGLPCHDENDSASANGWDGMGSGMGNGMMGW